MKRSTIVLALLLVVAALALHLSVSWQDFSTLAKNGYLYDDSFYAFQIARNIADGQGATFDGHTPTNGFQPLYVFALVPVYKWFGSDGITPIYAALTLLALLTVATAVMLMELNEATVCSTVVRSPEPTIVVLIGETGSSSEHDTLMIISNIQNRRFSLLNIHTSTQVFYGSPKDGCQPPIDY